MSERIGESAPATAPACRIAMWSGPRNVSTALMYAFAQRPDTEVIDEPLYAHYLRVSGADHPGRDVVLAAGDGNGDRVVREVVLGRTVAPVRFMKMMAHHLMGLDLDFLAQTRNMILTRDPREVLPTLSVQLGQPQLADTGYDVQVELMRGEIAQGRQPLVLDAKNLLMNPERVLSRTCHRLGLGFDPAMLRWPPGPKPYDGAWAPYWYHNVHRSSGFAAYRPKVEPFPERLQSLLAQCLPFYEELKSHAIHYE